MATAITEEKTMVKTTIIALILGFATFSVAQTQTVKLVDVSNPAQKFITFTGSMTLTSQGKNTYSASNESATGQNVSGKDIVAFLAYLKWGVNGPDMQMLFRHDHFFKAHDLMNGESFQIPINGETFTEPLSGSGTPHFTIQVGAIQFSDGSTWGDATALQWIASNREGLRNYLQQLLNTYTNSGEQAFLSLLEQPQPRGTSSASISAALQGQPVSTAIPYITTSLRNGNGRSAAVKNMSPQ